MNLDEYLATELMGWKEKGEKISYSFSSHYWVDKNNKTMCSYLTWNPTKQIDQAMMCVEKFHDWKIEKEYLNEFEVVVVAKNGDLGEAYCLTLNPKPLPLIISTACAKALGWEESHE